MRIRIVWVIISIVFMLTLSPHTNQSNTFVLITTLYNEQDNARRQEYITCMEKNLSNDAIDTVHVLYDTAKDNQDASVLSYLKTKPVHITFIKGRATYGMCFDLARELYKNRKVVVCNADIFFDDTLKLLDTYDLTDHFLALTRWNVLKDGSIEIFKQYDSFGNFSHILSESSHDAWLFVSPLRKFNNEQFCLGIMDCDAAIAYQAQASGLHVLNPCLSILSYHLHLSGLRHYNAKDHPYAQFPKMAVPWIALPQ